jgi:hypothetical protein
MNPSWDTSARRQRARYGLLLPLLIALAACQNTPAVPTDPYANGAQYPWRDTTVTAQAVSVTTGYLSDQAWSSATNGWGPIERDASNGEQNAADGGAISGNARTYTKGLGAHAASQVKYALSGACSSFQAVVGLDDEIRHQSQYGSVVFQVWTDGVKRFDSGKLTVASAAQNVNVDLSGGQELMLVVTDAGDGNRYDHVDWADAKVVCNGVVTPPPPPPAGQYDRFLSDLTPTSALNGWGSFEKDISNGENQLGDGRTLSLRSQTFERGLGVHAASDLRYALNGQCQTFRAVVGVDDETAGRGTVVFQVWADGAKLYDSATVKTTSAALGVNVSVSGRQELQLVVTDAGDGNAYDHADWADARLTCGTPPAPPPPPPPPPPALCTTGPCATGQWSAIQSWPVLAIHASMLPDGTVKTWGWRNSDNKAAAVLADTWNPTTNAHLAATEAGNDIFGSGHDLTEDGRLFVAGGSDPAKPEWTGIPDLWLYNASSRGWSAGPKMQQGARWYPTVTALANGEMLVSSGFNNGGSDIDEVWNASTGWRSLTGAARGMALYPFMHVAPDGRVFNSGPNPDMAWLNTSGAGSWQAATTRDTIYRDYGSAVQYADGKLLVLGGSSPAVSSALTVDMRSGQATATSPMPSARRNQNATILPNGQVLVTGGNSSGNNDGPFVKDSDLWNPATGQWTRLAAAAAPRPYHSTALLLPDGRILTGGGWVLADSRNAEIFSPPYLFAPDGTPAVRPAISSAPSSVTFGSSFQISSPDAAGVSRVTLIRLSSVTHANNAGQRFNQIAFNASGTTLNLTAPANGNLAPPGYYLLFVLNAQGVPSVGKIVQLRRP